jgi:hypothetical protein
MGRADERWFAGSFRLLTGFILPAKVLKSKHPAYFFWITGKLIRRIILPLNLFMILINLLNRRNPVFVQRNFGICNSMYILVEWL